MVFVRGFAVAERLGAGERDRLGLRDSLEQVGQRVQFNRVGVFGQVVLARVGAQEPVGDLQAVVVEEVDDKLGRLGVRVGQLLGHVVLSDEERYNPKHLPPSQFAKPGALLRVRLAEAGDADHAPRLRLVRGREKKMRLR